MASAREVVVLSGVRTPIGGYGGSLKDLPPCDLAARCVREAVARVAAQGLNGWTEMFSAAVLARAYGLAGFPEEGLQVLETLPESTGIGFYQPELHRVRGELLLALTIAWLVSGLLLLSSTFLHRILRERGLIAMERLMGMLLVMVSVQMLMNGVRVFIRP